MRYVESLVFHCTASGASRLPSGGMQAFSVRCCIVGLLVLADLSVASAQERMPEQFSVGIEAAAVSFARNDVRIPGDTGTRFDMTELTGSGPEFVGRLFGRWNISERHSLKLELALLEVTGTGELETQTQFDDETFAAGEATGTYQFNAYKLTYRYALSDRGAWRWGVGFTGLIRDADVALRQGVRVANNDNVGFVPALHLSGAYRFNRRWQLRLDVDGLAGGPGRLFDVAIKLDAALSPRWSVGAGYRTLEGGADTDDVFNFAWLNYAVFDLRYHF